jgi:DNA-binding beta-propeller fold protein YncE
MRTSKAVTALAVLSMALAACGSDEQRPEPATAPDRGTLPAVPEPATAPDARDVPAGKVVPLGGQPEGIVADPVSGSVAVAIREPPAVVILDHQGAEIGRVPLSGPPRHLDLAPGGVVLAPSESSDQLIAVHLPTAAIQSTTAVGRQPHDVAFAAGRTFAGDELGDTVSVIEGERVVTTIPVPAQPGGVASNGRTVAVVGVRARQMLAIDAASLAPLATVPSGVGPTHVVAGPDGRYYVADTQGDQVLVFDDQPSLHQVADTPAVGAPYGIAVDADRRRLWVTLTAANKLVSYDISGPEPRQVATFATVRQPNSVTVDPSTGLVFVTGTAENQLQIVDPEL